MTHPGAGAGPRLGMTLIEVIIGLLVASTAVALGFAALHGVAEAARRTDAAGGAALARAEVRRQLGEWLSHAHLEPGGRLSFAGVDGAWQGLADATVSFWTLAPSDSEGRPVPVRLFVDRTEGAVSGPLMAEIGSAGDGGNFRLTVADSVSSLQVRYLSGIPGDDRWLSSWISRSVLPRAVILSAWGPGSSTPADHGIELLVPLRGGAR